MGVSSSRRRSYKTVCLISNQSVFGTDVTYAWLVPKLWNETIEAHRREVRDAILDTTPALVAEYGLRSVTMSQIAEETGVGRATLYKYFSGVEAILLAWHDRQISGHLEYLADVRGDVAPAELANYCLHALTAASSLPSKVAVRRLVAVTVAGLHPTA